MGSAMSDEIRERATTIYHAMRDTMGANDPRLKKHLIVTLMQTVWPTLKFESAQAKFNHCLSGTGSEYFKLSELITCMIAGGNHALYESLGQILGRRSDLIPTRETMLQQMQLLSDQMQSVAQRVVVMQALIERQEAVDPDATSPGQFSQPSTPESF